jgi:hypothetical protein
MFLTHTPHPQKNLRNLGYCGKKSNLRIIGIEVDEEMRLLSWLQGPENISNTKIEENCPNLKKEMSIYTQETYRTIIRLEHKRNPPAT